MSGDANTIHLEARFYGDGEPAAETLVCESVTLTDAQWSEQRGADGSVQRSMVRPPILVARGLPQGFDPRAGYNWIKADAAGGQWREARIDPQPGGAVHFILR